MNEDRSVRGPGTADGRMRAVWDWIHETGAGRERVLEELCPGWSIVSSRITSEQALMVAFDALVAERNDVPSNGKYAHDAEVVARTAFADDWNALAHSARVVSLLGADATDNEHAVAWLHDVIEDTKVEAVDLNDVGFPSEVVDAVVLLSRDYASDYDTYAAKLVNAPGEAGRIARKVKLADARENLARCESAQGVPKWERLAEKRYRPMVKNLELLVALDEIGDGG